MRLTVALPPQHRSSIEARLGDALHAALAWQDQGPADVVLGVEGPGALAHCPVWPGDEGALALVQAGFERLRDRKDMARLHEVGRALASEQNLDRLLDLILSSARSLLGAEAGSLYLVGGPPEARELLFAHTQNARVSLPYHRFRMPISTSSMAGFVAATGQSLNIKDVYRIPREAPYRFNDSFDRQASYRTTSMLVVPLKDTEGEVLGVLQLINRREEGEVPERAGEPVPFRAEHQALAESLAGQAGVAVKNAHLREEIERLFESFVNASVLAIEQRDPATSGHSGRVASLSVGLAEAINDTPSGPFGALRFTPAQIRELRYASLLHDFGKVGVREQVLVKSKKLEPHRLELILQRLGQRRQEQIIERMGQDWKAGRPYDAADWEAFLRESEGELARLTELVARSNEPTVLPEEAAGELSRLGELRFLHWRDGEQRILETPDLACLSIRKGSLSEEERSEIESHVTHTFNFLSQIPWTRDLAAVPEIAYAHHERVNGRGYPRRLSEPEIPLQSRAMAIADVFDALTAQDRPYKAAVPLERSLRILEDEARSGGVDAELFALFVEARVYEKALGRS